MFRIIFLATKNYNNNLEFTEIKNGTSKPKSRNGKEINETGF